MEKELWQQIVDGDRQAYAGLYRDYFKKFYNYGRKFTADALLVEDCIQEVFLDFWTRREAARPIDSPNSYLFSAFRFTLFKKMKQSARYVPSEEVEEGPDFSIDALIIGRESDSELQRRLQAALESLTARQREAIFLRFYEGLSYEEVASVLGISVKATYKIMARSLATLKENMGVLLGVLLALLRQSQGF
ncbi:sigma-70 family RNA polymerase sigma factor [Paraflavisolibacter sp. H34]|uniref:RNA polymerase sigma factor n=1 Tax=Huijunlia imazamoxiresistens TaxID=3127457 RepID=UPI0030186932